MIYKQISYEALIVIATYIVTLYLESAEGQKKNK